MALKAITIIILFIIFNPSQPKADPATAMGIMELVSLTVTQVNELEQLLSNAEKYTAKYERYNQLIQDYHYRAILIVELGNEMVNLNDSQIKNLGTLNDFIRRYKGYGRSAKYYVADFYIKEHANSKQQKQISRNDKTLKKDQRNATRQASRSFTASTGINVNQLTAQNTAMTQKNTADLKVLANQSLHKQSEQNEMIASDLKRKREQEMDREKFYGYQKRDRLNASDGKIKKINIKSVAGENITKEVPNE